MNMKLTDCGATARQVSAAEEAFSEIEVALKILNEAVERIAMKTTDVRVNCPAATRCGNEATDRPPAAPLVCRLRDIKASICWNTDNLNNLSDDIQL